MEVTILVDADVTHQQLHYIASSILSVAPFEMQKSTPGFNHVKLPVTRVELYLKTAGPSCQEENLDL